VNSVPGNRSRSEGILRAAFARFDVRALGIATGAFAAAAIFVLTAVLLLKAQPPTQAVGPHLANLAIALPGYSVSWSGGIIGAVEGFVLGYLVGIVFAMGWNVAHFFYLMSAVFRRGAGADL
jgi:hypothetical protein